MISELSAPDHLFQGAFLEYWEARPLSYNPNPNTERTNAPPSVVRLRSVITFSTWLWDMSTVQI